MNLKWILDFSIRIKNVKLVGENICEIWFGKDFLGTTNKARNIKRKDSQIGLHENKEPLTFKIYSKKDEKGRHRLRENIYKRCLWWRICISTIKNSYNSIITKKNKLDKRFK